MRVLVPSLAAILWFQWLGFAQGKPQATLGASSHTSQGIAFMRAGQAQKALDEFRAATTIDPDSTQALAWLGIALAQLGRFQESITPFSRALKLDPSLEVVRYNLGLSYARLGNRKSAIHELKQVADAAPSMSDAQYNLAVLFEQDGSAAQAIPYLEAARHLHPDDTEIQLHLARDLFLCNRGSEALEISKSLFQRDNQQNTKQLGELLVENGYFADAVPILESARSATPGSVELQRLLGRAYVGAGFPSKAIDLLKQHEKLDISGATAYLLGLAYLGQKQPAPALQSFRIAADLRPADSLVHFHIGGLLLMSSAVPDQESGIGELHKAIDLLPQESMYYTALARWLIEHNRLNEAMTVLGNGEEHAHPSAELYALLSVAEALHQSPQAKTSAEKAIALDPKMALAHDVLGFFYFRSGDYLRAAESYKTASALSPGTGRFAYDTALALERANKPAEAVSYAERAAAMDPDVPINHYFLGKLYSKVNRKPESIRELKTAVRLNPSLDYPYYLLARMYMRMGDTEKAREWDRKLQELKREQMKLHGVETMTSEPEATPSLPLEKGQLDTDSVPH